MEKKLIKQTCLLMKGWISLQFEMSWDANFFAGRFINLIVPLLNFSFYSDEENIPEEPPSVRPSRRAKIAALDKTKQDLTALMNQEANGS